MQIEVIGTAQALTAQTRAYAEYRVFSRLAPAGDEISAVLVVVSRAGDSGDTVCHASARLHGAGSVRISTRHAAPTGAIDAAAERLAAAVHRRLQAPTAQ